MGRSARRPVEALEEPQHALEREDAFVRTSELRADVDVHALDLEPELARSLDLPLGRVGSQAELRLLVCGLDRAVRHGLDARRQPDEDAAHACGRRGLGLAGSVDHDERAGFRGRP